MTCPECGEWMDHNVCQKYGHERDPGDDCDAAYDQWREDRAFFSPGEIRSLNQMSEPI